MKNISQRLNLYVHIPFCKSKCKYCDFFSLPKKERLMKAYFNALVKELKLYRAKLSDYIISTIYVGGGTPSLADPLLIEDLLQYINKNFRIVNSPEITIEANPDTLNFDKLLSYKKAGVNRISIGLQASQLKLLKYLGRTYAYNQFKSTIKSARKAGFRNINVDLIFGIPGQSIRDWEITLQKVINLNIQHISCYSLSLDNNSYLGRLKKLSKSGKFENKNDRKMYHMAVKMLRSNGFFQYEISNFSRKGFECRHNLNFWNFNEYIGIGAGAHSFFQNYRYCNILNLDKYINLINTGKSGYIKRTRLSKKDKIFEYIILKLRLNSGLDIEEFNKIFKKSFTKFYSKEIRYLTGKNLLHKTGNRLKLTKKGLYFENYIISKFI